MRTAAAAALQHASHDLAASTADSALSKAEDAKAEAVKALIKTQAAALEWPYSNTPIECL